MEHNDMHMCGLFPLCMVLFGDISDFNKKGRKKLGKGAQVGGKGGPSPLHPPNGDAFGPPLYPAITVM